MWFANRQQNYKREAHRTAFFSSQWERKSSTCLNGQFFLFFRLIFSNSCHFHLFSFALHRQIISQKFIQFFCCCFVPHNNSNRTRIGLLLSWLFHAVLRLCAHYSNEMSARRSSHRRRRFLNIGRKQRTELKTTNCLNFKKWFDTFLFNSREKSQITFAPPNRR